MVKKTKKVQPKRTKKTTYPTRVVLPPVMTQEPTTHSESCPRCCRVSKTGLVAIILGLIIIGLLAINKGLIVAAIVDNKPIFRWTMNQALVSRYGNQTLENLVTEQLIAAEAKRLRVEVTQSEIDAEQQKILQSFGGNVTLEEVLKFQGMTKADFDQQIRLQMLLTKLIGKDVTITDEEINAYIADNKAVLVATETEGMRQEAKDALILQKVGENLQPWFTALKEKAKIYRFVK